MEYFVQYWTSRKLQIHRTERSKTDQRSEKYELHKIRLRAVLLPNLERRRLSRQNGL